MTLHHLVFVWQILDSSNSMCKALESLQHVLVLLGM